LWTDFGVRADIVVTVLFWIFYSLLNTFLKPFTCGFPRADIHELLSPDLLHQVIKGTFKDHFVTWVNDYLLEVHGEAHGLEIIADIDHRYLTFILVPSRRLPFICQHFGSSCISRIAAIP
jgi:hypothetical protein